MRIFHSSLNFHFWFIFIVKQHLRKDKENWVMNCFRFDKKLCTLLIYQTVLTVDTLNTLEVHREQRNEIEKSFPFGTYRKFILLSHLSFDQHSKPIRWKWMFGVRWSIFHSGECVLIFWKRKALFLVGGL